MKIKGIAILLANLVLGLIVQAQNGLIPPYNLQAEVVDDNVQLSWNAPDTLGGSYLSWDNGITGNSIGLGGEGGNFAVAARWDSEQLTPWIGYTIDKVAFYLGSENASYSGRIWWGENADSLAWSQDIENLVSGDWTYVFLNNPIYINNFQDLWVGYEIDQPAGEYPAGADFGPVVAGYGDMVNLNGEWESLYNAYGLDNNFNVRVYVSNGNKSFVLDLPAQPAEFDYSNSENPVLAAGLPVIKNNGDKIMEDVIGYNIYRNNEQIASIDAADTNFLDEKPGPGLYNYGVSAVYSSGESPTTNISVLVGTQELSVYPDSITDTVFIGESYTFPLTLANNGDLEIYWILYSSDFWIYSIPQAGYLLPGEQIISTVNIITTQLSPGWNSGEVWVYGEGPGNLMATVPVNLFALGQPLISVTPPELNFGDVILGEDPTINLAIHNNGSDTLEIASITSSSSKFSVGEYEDFILPNQQMVVAVGFDASTLGESTGEISITSNDAMNPEIIVPASGFVYLQPPAYVNATIDDTDVTLEWDMGLSGPGNWLHFDSGNGYTAIGLTEGGTWQYAARWYADDLINYSGQPVGKVAFLPRSASSQYTLKIWKGENAQTTLVSQAISNFEVDQYNEVIIQNPFNIDPTEDLWVGFEVSQPAGEFPGGVDEGPAVAAQGDMLNAGDGWISGALSLGLDYNWNIQVYVLDGSSQYATINPNPVIENKTLANASGNPVTAEGFVPFVNNGPDNKAPMSEVIGYNVYRDDVQLNSALITEQTYTDSGLEFGLYEYGVSAVYAEGESPQTNKLVQIGAPEISFDPVEIEDSLENGESSTHIVNIENTGNFTLNWFAYPSEDWISISESEGSLEPGESTSATVTLNSLALFGGNYEGGIEFEVNNLNAPTATLPIQLKVSGDAQLVVTPDSIQFGLTAVNTTKTSYVTLSNIGNDFILIQSMTASPEMFSSGSFQVYLYPGGVVNFPVYFSPEEPGNFEGILEIVTGEPGGAVYEVPLSGTSLLPMPKNFTASVDSNNVQLDWQSPLGGLGDYLQYCSDESSNAIGYSGGGSFVVAAKFSPEELMTFTGSDLTTVSFVPWSADAFFTIKVWMGENAENLMINQPVGLTTPFEWNDIQLNMQVPVDTSDYLWIGYEVVHDPDDYPAGCDMGPAVEGKGNLISTDGIEWGTLSYYGLDMNWSIRGIVDQGNKAMTLSPIQQTVPTKLENKGVLKPKFVPAQQNLKFNPASLELYGYNVYRDGMILNDSVLISESEYLDLILEPGIYNYGVTAVYNLGESMPAGPLEVNVSPAASSPTGWSPQPTAMTHIIHIPTQGSESGFMSPGDWIGVFFNDDGVWKCGGSIMWSEVDSLKMVVYGDNPSTPQKEGFAVDEWLDWKVFMADSEEEHTIDVFYNPAMPNWDGNFHMLGESALTGMELSITGIDQFESSDIKIFPNPNNGNFSLSGISSFNRISIFNATGIEIFKEEINGRSIFEISIDQPAGLYYLILQRDGNREVRKIILQK